MVKIEVNNVTVHVPQSWEDVKLGDYEQYYKDKPETARQRAEFVAKILKLDVQVLLDWPAEIYNYIVEQIGFLFGDNPIQAQPYIEVNGQQYVVELEDRQTLGAWVDAEEAQKAGTAVLSTVLSIVCRPVGEKYDYERAEQRQRLFASLPVSKVLGVLAFFLQCKTDLDKLTAAYTKLQEIADRLPRNIKPFLKRGGGTRLSRIWQATKYCVLTALLRYRLRKLSRIYNINAINR